MSNYYIHHGAYPAYSATPTWGVSQDGDGTDLGLSTPAIASIVLNSVAVATNTLTIAGATLTAVASGAGFNQFNVGATLDIQANNIASAINSFATSVTNSGTNAVNTQLRDWLYARGPSTGAPSGTVELMTRVGSVQFNYATNSNVFITSSGWTSAPTITQFTGGISGVSGYFINMDTMFPSIKTGGNYGFLIYGHGPSSIVPGPGDTIYVRTKASGVDISCTNTNFNNNSINLRQFSSVASNPTKVIFDDGTIWSGDNGVFKFSKTYSSGSMTIFQNANTYISFLGKDRSDLGAGKKNFKIVDESNVGANYYINWSATVSCFYRDIEFSDEHTGSYVTSSCMYLNGSSINLSMNNPTTFYNCTFRVNNSAANGYGFLRHSFSYPINLYFKKCDFYFTSQTVANGGLLTDNTTSAGTNTALVFDMCTFHGLFNGANKLLSTSGAGQSSKFPATYLIKNCHGIDAVSGTFGYYAHGGTATGTATSVDVWGKFIAINNNRLTYFENGLGYYILQNLDGGYPTLYSQDMSGNYFSCLISPSSRSTECISAFNPFYVTEFSKFNTLSDGSRTLTFEFLIDQNYTTISTETLAIEVSYINTSGVQEYYSSKANLGLGVSLTSSSVGWSSTVYVINSIAHNYDKKKITFSLPTNVKQNTLVVAKVAVFTPAPSANDFIFVDPDFEVV